ncbi:unnamed protein product [Protopolystoma xenopodis]|uniref:Uncharacterized protein n=1 Tax=Protopolystoma xenopodis TaxID=117903 RepID=A0A448X4G1_9PLAT|nr:unnamed protein product [Protopolystoma xenopodis]
MTNCYERQQYQCRALLHAVRRVYTSQSPSSFLTSVEQQTRTLATQIDDAAAAESIAAIQAQSIQANRVEDNKSGEEDEEVDNEYDEEAEEELEVEEEEEKQAEIEERGLVYSNKEALEVEFNYGSTGKDYELTPPRSRKIDHVRHVPLHDDYRSADDQSRLGRCLTRDFKPEDASQCTSGLVKPASELTGLIAEAKTSVKTISVSNRSSGCHGDILLPVEHNSADFEYLSHILPPMLRSRQSRQFQVAQLPAHSVRNSNTANSVLTTELELQRAHIARLLGPSAVTMGEAELDMTALLLQRMSAAYLTEQARRNARKKSFFAKALRKKVSHLKLR